MATNYIEMGGVWDHTPASAVASGSVVVMNDTVGVAVTDIAAGATGAVQVDGVFSLPKDNSAIGQGKKVYWDGSAITTTDSGNTYAGRAITETVAGDATIAVALNQ